MEFPDWRFNVRMSNTEPVVRLNVESRGDAALMEARRDELLAIVHAFVACIGARSRTWPARTIPLRRSQVTPTGVETRPTKRRVDAGAGHARDRTGPSRPSPLAAEVVALRVHRIDQAFAALAAPVADLARAAVCGLRIQIDFVVHQARRCTR
jgi:hypothetical protein